MNDSALGRTHSDPHNSPHYEDRTLPPLSKLPDFSRNNSQVDSHPNTSQLLLVPGQLNPEGSRFSPHNTSPVRGNFTHEASKHLKRPPPLFERRFSSNSSKPSEVHGESYMRPLSGISSNKEGIRTNNRKDSYKGTISPMNKSGVTSNQSRNMGRLDDTSQEMNSYSHSALRQIEKYFYENGDRSQHSNMSSATKKRRMGTWKNKVKETYYTLLRKRFGRRPSYIREDPPEFDEQIQIINNNVRIPNDERLRDLILEEKTALERAKTYHDKYPLLGFRKSLMKLFSYISSICYVIITNPAFDLFILAIIISNSILLALDDPTSDNSNFAGTDSFYLTIYTGEMVLKILGLGFIFNRHSYLRDPWNILDFIIVITGYLPLILVTDKIDLRAFRSLRVLRPLKAIASIKALRIIVLTLMAAMKPLLQTFLILFFLFLIFAIAGLNLFSGSMKKRCFSIDDGITIMVQEAGNIVEKYCMNDSDCGLINGINSICGRMVLNPNYGVTHFDNILSSLLMAFQTVTMEGWSNVMGVLQETFSPLAAIYFIILIFIGTFFLLNLTLAIIKAEFTAHARVSVASKRIRKATYDERFMEKLRDHKLDILRLIHRNITGETLFNKYHFKNDQLIAIESSKDKTAVPKKRRDAMKKTPTNGFLFLDAISKLKPRLMNSFKKRFSVSNNAFAESKTNVPSLMELGSMNSLDRVKGTINKVYPIVDSRTELIQKDEQGTTPSEGGAFSFRQRLTINQKGNTESSVASPPLPSQDGARYDPENMNNLPGNNEERQSESHVQVYKQPRGFGDLKIKITEAGPSGDDNKENEQEPQQGEGYGVLRVYPVHIHPSVPSIIEEEEFSELSPPRSSTHPDEQGSKLFTGSIGNTMGQREHIRAVMSEKVRIKKGTVNPNPIQLVNIAGIRNKKNVPTKHAKKAKVRKLEEEDEFNSNKEENGNEKDDNMDNLDDDEWFLQFLKAQEEANTLRQEGKRRGTFIQKINQIKKLRDGLARNHSGPPRSVTGSDIGNSRKHTVLVSEDYEPSNARNSSTHLHRERSSQRAGTILEDSDFFERKKIRRATKKHSSKMQLNRKKTMIGKGVLKGLHIKSQENKDKDGILETQAELETQAQENLITEEERIELKEQEKNMIVDLKKLKALPLFSREYLSASIDDVAPSKKENERIMQEKEEARKIKENRLPQSYKITKSDLKAAMKRKILKEKEAKENEYNMVLAFRGSQQGMEARSKMKEQTELEQDANFGSLERFRKSKSESERSGSTWTKANGKTMSRPGGGKIAYSLSRYSNTTGKSQKKKLEDKEKEEEEEEPDLTNEQMKDMFAVLRRIQTPYANEKENEESEAYKKKIQEFEFNQEYRRIRVKDLEENKIRIRNWSGNSVLQITHGNFPMDRVKMAMNVRDWDIWRPGFMGVIHELRRMARNFVDSSFFNGIIILSVLINTIILCCDGLVGDEDTISTFRSMNLAFTIIFAVEMGLKIFGLGITNYALDTINLFDAVVVILSIVEEIFLVGKNNAAGAFRAVRLFRTFRVLRVTKLLRSLSYMKVIMGVILRSLKKFIYVLLLLLLLIFIYTLLGMQLFGGKLSIDDNIGDDRVRQNFDTFGNGFMTVFQIMTQEDWQTVLFLFFRSSIAKAITIIYLVSWIFIGNYIFLNLFLALLLDEFTSDEAEEDLEEAEHEDDEEPEENSKGEKLVRKGSHLSIQRSPSISSLPSMSATFTDFDDDQDVGKNNNIMWFTGIPCTNSLYLFSKFSYTRKACYWLVTHKYFDKGILAIIALNSIKLVLDTYINDDDTTLNLVSDIFDDIFVALFALEAAMKIVCYGFVLDRNSYLRDGWNVLDFIIVVTSILDVSLEFSQLSFIKVLRLLRTLRPLRFISHNQNMRIVVTALMESFGAIINVLIVILMIWIMFAILAMSLFRDQLGYCSGSSIMTRYGVSRDECLSTGNSWDVYTVNFDNIFRAILSLFIISTQEGWPTIMYRMVDANTSDEGPTVDNNLTVAYIYFIVFLFVGSYFLVNLFIGVIFLNFTRAHKKENSRLKFLTEQQQKWVTVQRLVLLTQPNVSLVEPREAWRKRFFKLVTHDYFEYFILSCVVLNVVAMGLSYDDASDTYNNVLEAINYFFTGIFTIEMIFKHFGLGARRYWSIGWNRFDGVVVIASLIDILIVIISSESATFLRAVPQLARVFRVLRVSRLFRLIRKFRELKKLLNTLIFSLPSLMNIGSLLLLIFFIYSVLATFIFGDIKEGNVIDDNTNFNNFTDALVTLFRASTGEDWFTIMFDTVNPRECKAGVDSCGTGAAILFWVSFIVICQFVFLNLFILAILQQFEEYHLNPNNPVNKFRENVEGEFNMIWQEMAARHGGTEIHEKKLPLFLRSLSPPLGFKGEEITNKELNVEIMQMELTTDDTGMLFYNDVLYACMRRIYAEDALIGGNLKLLIKEELKVKKRLKRIKRKVLLRRTDSITSATTKNPVNPVMRMLFMGMTMKAWMRYSLRVAEKIKAAKENGIPYIASDSDENDYEYESEENSSPSIERDISQEEVSENHEEEEEHISEEQSEEAISEEEGKPSPYRQERSGNYSRVQIKSRSYQEPDQIRPHSREEPDLVVSHEMTPTVRRQPYRNKTDKWVITHHGPEFGHHVGIPIDQISSSERELVHGRPTSGYPFNVHTPRKDGKRIDSDWGSPERLSPSQFLRLEHANIPESSKSLFELLEADKSSQMSPSSQRHSTVNPREDYAITFNPEAHHGLQTPQNKDLRVPLMERLDSNFLAPPLGRELSGPFTSKSGVSRADAHDVYDNADKDFLNIPISMSRINSRQKDEERLGTKDTPKSSLDIYKQFAI